MSVVVGIKTTEGISRSKTHPGQLSSLIEDNKVTNNVDFSVSLLSDCGRPRVDVLDNCCLEDGGAAHGMVTSA